VTIAGAGHLAPLETPEAVERLLREFLGGADG
jgi:pimeloyl-ACP methyl ester carboxylesterase